MKGDLYKILTKDMSYTNKNSFADNMLTATVIIIGIMALGCMIALAFGVKTIDLFNI